MKSRQWLTVMCASVLVVCCGQGVFAAAPEGNRAGSGIQLSRPAARSADETMKLILQRVERRKRELKVIDKVVFLSNGENLNLPVSVKSLKTYSVLQFDREFEGMGIAYRPDGGGTGTIRGGKASEPDSRLGRGMAVYELNYCLHPDSGMVAYALKLTIADGDAVEDYMASWDLPPVWQGENLGVTTKKSLQSDIKKDINLLTAKAASDFRKSALSWWKGMKN